MINISSLENLIEVVADLFVLTIYLNLKLKTYFLTHFSYHNYITKKNPRPESPFKFMDVSENEVSKICAFFQLRMFREKDLNATTQVTCAVFFLFL